MTQRFVIPTLCSIGMFVSSLTLAQTPPPATTAPANNATPPCGSAVSGKNMAAASRCFELRTYTLRPGGAGSIDLLHARFREVSSRLFIKHGMTLIGFWQPVAMPDTMIYLLAYKDGATRDAQWAAFNTDPEWVETRARMEVTLNVTRVFMNATDYSPIK